MFSIYICIYLICNIIYDIIDVEVIVTFPYQMMYVSLNINLQGVTCGAGSAYPSRAADVNLEFG